MKNKKVAVMLACTLALGCAVGGSLAWLTDNTEDITNTFTIGDINIKLEEKGTDTNGNKGYDFVPGDTLSKDPKVTVLANSEDCYLFVKVTEKNNTYTGLTGDIIQWNVDESIWIPHTGVGVPETDANGNQVSFWYRIVKESDDNQSWNILEKDKVTVNTGITKEMYGSRENNTGIFYNKPELVFDAAAVQIANLADKVAGENESAEDVAKENVAEAWSQLDDEFRCVTSNSGSSGQ